jgi:hypothetical protein
MSKKLWNSEDLLNSRGLVSCGVCLAVYGEEGHNCETTQKLCGACCQYFGQNEADKQGWHSPAFCDLAPICQLCGGTIEDITAGAVVLPWGDTCGECMKEIQTTKEGK